MTDVSGANWFKSSYSNQGGDCVEIAHIAEGMVGVRDSKNPTGPALVFTSSAWDAFIVGAQTGQFDRT
ncbi:DUF397 domain-containing protein [Nocardia sp. NBC_01499]|uniref:DUF397 domain-containing protein n=1 Tax=Nocardia sp. NBC_01499 TaxID=2903597 RepID=UPI00386C4C71